MKRILLTLLVLLLLPLTASATITVTARGLASNSTSSTTYVVSPQSTIAAGTLGVLGIALDNAGAAGASTVCNTTMTDSVGNVWTVRQNGLFDNGAANAGVEIAIYTAPITTQITTSDTVTVDFTGKSVTAKVVAFWELSSSVGTVVYSTGALGTGATTSTPSVTTSSITSGDAVVGFLGIENSAAPTADSDTTNGSWSSQQAAFTGFSTTGITGASQVKVVTATATQTYNPTLGGSFDTMIGWISLTEVITPPALIRRAIFSE